MLPCHHPFSLLLLSNYPTWFGLICEIHYSKSKNGIFFFLRKNLCLGLGGVSIFPSKKVYILAFVHPAFSLWLPLECQLEVCWNFFFYFFLCINFSLIFSLYHAGLHSLIQWKLTSLKIISAYPSSNSVILAVIK